MRMIRCKKDITILAPSKEAQDLSASFVGMQIVNPVQVIDKYEELHYAYYKAIKEISTEFFYIYDNDDKIPDLPETFPNAGIIFGDTWISYKGQVERYPANNWSFKRHIKHPQFVHRAICRTEETLLILEKVKHLPILTEWWLYSHLAKDFSFYYDPSMVIVWDKKDTGLHKKSRDVIKNTRELFKSTYQ